MAIKKLLKFFLGKKQLQWPYRFLFFIGLKGMNFGGGSDFRESGEEWVLKNFAKSFEGKQLIFFDVGANIGGYALEADKIMSDFGLNYKILCFEPAKNIFMQLIQTISERKNFFAFNLALGEKTLRMPLYSTKAASGLSSLHNRETIEGMQAIEEVEVTTLDTFCSQHNIANIDFLKLDVEGNEYAALLGAKELIANKKIQNIQFEFGGTDIDARIFFRDFYKLLTPNFRLYRILKNGLEPIKEYKEIDEIFITTNYLAILRK